MKQTLKLSLSAVLIFATTSSYATNGSVLTGIGAKSRAMGGTGIGVGHGADSALINPSLITSIKNEHEISFGGTLFMPDVSSDGGSAGMMVSSSSADKSVIPSVSLATKLNDNFFWGVGMWGTAGMGVDYRSSTNPGTMNMVTNLQLMQFGIPLAYTIKGISLGVTPVLQYGALDINYNNGNTDANYAGTGTGIAQDLAMGYNLGVSYGISGATVGISYKSQIDMEYTGQLSSATAPFVAQGIFPMALKDTLSTPVEIGLGASYEIQAHTIALDYKNIKWSDAEGYKDFKWQDQDVIALGYQYATKKWALRLGYNQSDSPIEDAGGMTITQAQAAWMASGSTNPADMSQYFGANAVNTFNLAGFPAIVESHITFGGSYSFSDTTSLDLAYVYAPESTTKLQTMPADTDNDGNPDTDVTTEVKHSQTSLSLQLNYAF